MSSTRRVYLDYNATAPIRPEAAAAVAEALGAVGNPSSVHGEGRAARARLEAARRAIAASVGAEARHLLFTSGGTEADHLALAGPARERLLVSAIEHDAVLAPATRLDPDVERIPVTADGVIDLAALERSLDAADGVRVLVSVMLANNETGVIQPVAEVARLAKARGALVHCDAVQAFGKIAIDIGALGVDLLSLSAHKIGGPQGVGALVLGGDLDLAPLQVGGGQEFRRRAGTENLPGIAGFAAAAGAAQGDLDRMARIAGIRDDLEARLRRLDPALPIFGETAERLPNTTAFALAGMPSATQIMALDLDGIAVSAGAACSSGKVQSSHVLEAMGVDPELAASAIRVSFGWASEPGDAARLAEAWGALRERTGRRGAA
ncbi:cysteine desulfurase family protein [Oceanibacterium hippocampi]|uniref:Cysteine desulfurase n=1 Tax=Oceanibacterium hippocampi TaxID=745714 RepID=A0A1Y5T0R2_9PROT|nr:cysteine desulfurase family protein [Oceanibacterium hippocampi]SLN49400.1 Cysteine desulfurase [Oceanibacterium hippocampi]